MVALTRIRTTIFICRWVDLNSKLSEEFKRFLILIIITFNSDIRDYTLIYLKLKMALPHTFKYQNNCLFFFLCNLFSLIEIHIDSLYILNASAYISHLI